MRVLSACGLLGFLGLLGCQTASPLPCPESYTFPRQFFVEQKLEIKGDGLKRNARAQLEKKGGDYSMVLTDPMTSMVLAKISMKKDESPSRDYIAPVISENTLPLNEIGESVRFLYESPAIGKVDGKYERRDPENRWTYTWTEFAEPACLFPKNLKLKFLKVNYELSIDLMKAECLP